MSKTKEKDLTVTKDMVTDEDLIDYYMQSVPLFLVKDKRKRSDDLTVTVNGTNYQIRRGIQVSVPRCVALAVERSHKQESDAEEYIESLKEV